MSISCIATDVTTHCLGLSEARPRVLEQIAVDLHFASFLSGGRHEDRFATTERAAGAPLLLSCVSSVQPVSFNFLERTAMILERPHRRDLVHFPDREIQRWAYLSHSPLSTIRLLTSVNIASFACDIRLLGYMVAYTMRINRFAARRWRSLGQSRVCSCGRVNAE